MMRKACVLNCHTNEHIGQCCTGTDSCKCRRTNKLADNNGVGHIVYLLKKTPKNHRHCKNRQRFEGRIGYQILIFRHSHIPPWYLYCSIRFIRLHNFRVVEPSRVYHTLPTNTTTQKTPMLTSEDAVHGSFAAPVTAYCYLLKVFSFSRPSLLATQMLATASPTTFREVTSISMGRLMARIRE